MCCARFTDALTAPHGLVDRLSLALHPRFCSRCRAEKSRIDRLTETLSDLPLPSPPPGLGARLASIAGAAESEIASERPVVRSPRHRRWRVVATAAALVLLLSAILYPIAQRTGVLASSGNSLLEMKESAIRRTCISNLKQDALALHMYAEDYTGRLPRQDTWPAGINPYIYNNAILNCPADNSGSGVSYEMPPGLGGSILNRPGAPDRAMLYDAAPDGTFAPRHAGPSGQWGGVVAWADGHVTWEASAPPGVPTGPVLGP